MSRYSVSVVVTTFNSPEILRLVLLGLARQITLPAEVLVADDGSEANTADTLERVAPEMPFSLIHLWQPHEDFRAARSRNNAIARARGDVVAFLDQDTIPHAGWLEAHVSGLGADQVSLGDVIALSREEAALLTEPAIRTGRFEHFLSLANRRRLAWLQAKYALYAWMRRQGAPVKSKPRLRSSNFAVPAAPLREVNGFDEAYVGWGQEDDDLGRRLYKLGVNPLIRVSAARVSHFPHPPRRPAHWHAGDNARRYADGADGSARCDAGLSKHPYPDVRVKVLSF
jgi:glycosyltransferase involved in cell wall biosynthesis